MEVPNVRSLFDFSGQVVLVTGAGGGIGKGIAARFAEASAKIAVHYHTSARAAQDLAQSISEGGGEAIALQADLTDAAQVTRLVHQTVHRFGALDVLVNNAALQPLAGLLEMTPDEWDAVIEANLRSAFLCTQAAAKQMITQGRGGAILNITSIEAENPAPNHGHYNASKGGLLMLTRASANELGSYGIRVNAVAPGLIWRPGIEQAWPEGVERWQKAAPLHRLGQPEDVADACLFLASRGARWITGASLTVDGGVMTHRVF